jgi:hypothetical protein
MLPGPSIPRKAPSQGVKGESPEPASKLDSISDSHYLLSILLLLTHHDMLTMLGLIKRQVLINEKGFLAAPSGGYIWEREGRSCVVMGSGLDM